MQWDQVHFEILHPKPHHNGSRNDLSCVLKITSQYGTILLTGDIEREAEIHLVKNYAEALAADILVAPHHAVVLHRPEASSNRFPPTWFYLPVAIKTGLTFQLQK